MYVRIHFYIRDFDARAQVRRAKEKLRVDVLLRVSELLAMLLFLGGLLFVVFFFPTLAHRTYFSENALLVNSADPDYGQSDAMVAQTVRPHIIV